MIRTTKARSRRRNLCGNGNRSSAACRTSTYCDVLARLEYQAGHAIVWRDAICNWFLRTSGIPDAKGRVGNHPDRIEAEAMQLKGYTAMDVTPWENASGGKGIECVKTSGCTASFRFDRAAGMYEMDVQYFDQNNGASKFRIFCWQPAGG